MKTKVSPFDRGLTTSYLGVLSAISVIVSFVLIAFQVPDDLTVRIIAGVVILFILLVIFFVLWVNANISRKAVLNFNHSTLEVKVGDLFDEPGLKVVSFNEFFDTQVDERLIASRTINGKFLNQDPSRQEDIDSKIETDERMAGKVVEVVSTRRLGKFKRYELGTVYEYGDYLLMAFSRFDHDNRAFLTMRDYVALLVNFWNEVDIIYAGRSVALPLLGSGITRMRDYTTISEQELLELLIWSFKISRVRFTYPSKVSIIIHESMADKINFYRLKER